MKNLSDKQVEVINNKEGSSLVIAGAGSGKTRVITEKIISLVETLKQGEKVLAITFSNKAAEELRDRLEKSLGKSTVKSFVDISTTHSFCLDVVTKRGHFIGLPQNLHIYDSESDRLKVFYEAINSVPVWEKKISNMKPEDREKRIRELFYLISKRKRELKFSEDYSDKPEARILFKEYDDVLLANCAIDYDDILRYTYKILVETPQVVKLYSRIYKHIFVDEAQDLNKAQYEVIRTLSDSGTIPTTMVGDPRQAIYGFNGSSAIYFEKYFPEQFTNVEIYELSENYRSSQKIIEYAKKLDSSYEITGVTPIVGDFQVKQFEDCLDESTWIVDKIECLLDKGHEDIDNLNISDFCIIARNKYVLNDLIAILEERKIQYTVKSSLINNNSYESDLFNSLDLVLKVTSNSSDSLHFDELIAFLESDSTEYNVEDILKRSSNKITKTLLRLLPCIEDGIDKDVNFNDILSILREYIEQFDIINEEVSVLISDYDDLEHKWKTFVKNSKLGSRTISHFLRAIALGTATVIENDDDKLTLSTVHMSKGLEYEVVFCMGLSEGTFPDYRSTTVDEINEEQHNLFVSITRAKKLCYVTYPTSKISRWGNTYQVQKSRFVEMLEK